ncbi:glycoside hydrolase family 3 protein [Cantharellus anzutake]|uniref:glycoside hydrolase family 3 protein n=1 Tax=Cantharellus anzutake TaxID=1750568 RepID=UPI001908433D|nr:glycoside hydrolase family 3 protein [Cantharellus anzutake]KAF8328930.1 glycoside hydrolase family 3 protein [Cantharellus anzutake]
MNTFFFALSIAFAILSTSVFALHKPYYRRGHHGPARLNTPRTDSTNPPGKWAAATNRAKGVVSTLSTEDKVALATGIGWQEGPCVGNIAAIPSINFPGLCLQDGPGGVRFADLISVFPAGINAAATFNRNLIRDRALALGAEFKAKGVNVALAPGMNMVRSPRAGRNWEMFGTDPYLAGEGSFETVMGLQANGLQACAKHFINNEQETNRQSSSSNVDDRTTHEIYLHPFLKAVQAGVVSVMCSYNQVDETWACENDHILNGLLKTELGFQGYVTTDWWVNMEKYKTLAANQGLDMVMPGASFYSGNVSYFGPALIDAVNSGQVPSSRLDDMATRILAAFYVQGQDQAYPAVNFDSWNPANGQHVDVRGDHGNLIRKIGAASTVLLKNSRGALPLGDGVKSLALVGSDAGPNPDGPNSCADRSCNIGILGIGWGSGTANFTYLVDPLSAITAKARSIGANVASSLSDYDLVAARNASMGKDAALVFITSDSGEGYLTVEGNPGDRNNLYAWHGGDALVNTVAGVNNNTIVVVHAVGAIIMEAWIDHPNVTAVIHAGLQGQEAGNSLVDILWGDVNPSGRLPYTIAKSPSDYSADIGPNHDVDYTEGLYLDYRWFDKQNISPRFPFGYGLSYTTFAYSGLAINKLGGDDGYEAPTGPGSSLSGWLHDDWIVVTFAVNNIGPVDGTEIPQLYLAPPDSSNSPPKQLRGFDSVFIPRYASSPVRMCLSRYSFAVWNAANQRWEIPRGTYGVRIGASSRDGKLSGSIEI